jgi:hypothetical protein
MLLSLTRKPARKRAYRIAFNPIGANLRRTGASDTLTGAASSVEFLKRGVRLRAKIMAGAVSYGEEVYLWITVSKPWRLPHS